MDGFRPTLGNSGAVLGPSRADADGREPRVHGERGGGCDVGLYVRKGDKRMINLSAPRFPSIVTSRHWRERHGISSETCITLFSPTDMTG